MVTKEITKVWLSGGRSCTLVIPKMLAKAYGIDRPIHVVIERQPEGPLIRKLEI